MKKVLVVEEDTLIRTMYKRLLEDRVETLMAEDLTVALRLFAEHPDIGAIAISGDPPGHDMKAPDFIRLVRNTYSGPIITTSFFGERRRSALKAGADHSVEKNGLPRKIHELLGIEE